MRKCLVLLMSLVLILGLFLSPSCVSKPVEVEVEVVRLKYGSTAVRSGIYSIMVAVAGVVNEAYPGEIEITVVETGGYIENVERMRKGTLDMCGCSTGASAASYLGIMDWEDNPDPDLRSLWGGYFTPIHLMATAESNITTVEGFEGRPYAMNPGMTSGWHIDYFLKAIEVHPSYSLMGTGAAIDAMKAGTVDGWFKAGFKDASILEVEAVRDIYIVPVTEENMRKAEEAQPGLHMCTTIPAGLFKSIKTDQLSYAYVISDFAYKDMPEDVVYKIVKAVWDKRFDLEDTNISLKRGKFSEMFGNAIEYDLTVPFHAGAVRFYHEQGFKVPDHLIPPEMK